jgi:hydrogenase maturation protein HypF
LQLTPDFGICDECKGELISKANRRFGYAFTTCVNCGPRWSITRSFPFERANTSINDFVMCEACEKEYTEPAHRRFHSQTNSCSNCGMHLELVSNKGIVESLSGQAVMKRTAELLADGKIIAIKNTGGYLLCCDASSSEVIKRLRKSKNRPGKPLALMYPDMKSLETDMVLSEHQKQALLSPERPIVLLDTNNSSFELPMGDIAPGLRQLGVMLPYSGILELLAQHLKGPVVATSGNLHGSPIISEKEKAEQLLSSVADFFLHHDLPILNTQDDSVVKFSEKRNDCTMFRRSRGYAPNFGSGTFKGRAPVLAMGSHLKGCIAYLPNDYLYVSQYLGNMDHFEVCERFEETVNSFLEVFRQEPSAILVDTHPAYHSSLYGKELARRWGVPAIGIQHHKAHFASVLGEHDLFDSREPILGVVWDGIGYGEDGQIWGGEFFTYSEGEMDRTAHFDYFDWLAADKMSREPRLSLLSLFDGDLPEDLQDKFNEEETLNYKRLMERNPLQTSSVGRIFDAVAAMLGLCDVNTYEGEAAMLLESLIHDYDLSQCKNYLPAIDGPSLDSRALIREVCKDWKESKDRSRVSANFHFTMAGSILEKARRAEIRKIACSGGVFQNTTLTDMLKDLAGDEFDVYLNINLAPNDENVSAGQVMFYLNQTKISDS